MFLVLLSSKNDIKECNFLDRTDEEERELARISGNQQPFLKVQSGHLDCNFLICVTMREGKHSNILHFVKLNIFACRLAYTYLARTHQATVS